VVSNQVLMAVPADPELDPQRLAEAQRGDEAACRALVEHHQQAVFALLSRMLGRGPLVEDLAQETFLRAFRALAGFDRAGPARLSTWLLTIATRLALDAQRKSGSRTEPIEDHAEALQAPHQPGSAELRSALARAILALPPDHRAAFLLREAHGLSTAEVARALEVEEGTVKSRLSRARAALREALEEHHG
jgi:RNA polymerase sigma-70 factor (ECF subfamily)